MKWLEITGANVTLAEDQPEYDTIKVRKSTTYIKQKGVLLPVACMTAHILPDEHDLKDIANGSGLYLNILGRVWQPCSLTTTDPILDYPQGQG